MGGEQGCRQEFRTLETHARTALWAALLFVLAGARLCAGTLALVSGPCATTTARSPDPHYRQTPKTNGHDHIAFD